MGTRVLNIHLVPVGSQGYELYCEHDESLASVADVSGTGLRARISRSFQQALSYIESERHRRHQREEAQQLRTWRQRMRDRVMAWVAERVAEQRLLWYLRIAGEGVVHHPDDLTDLQTGKLIRASLRRDARRHLIWSVIDAAWFVVFIPMTLIPGPNLPSYYFFFRMAGHVLCMSGARHGLARMEWRYVPAAPLTRLRECRTLAPVARDTLAHTVADQLNLRHLAAFVERMTSVRP